MITEILNRLEVLAGLADNEIEVEEARGISEDTWNAMTNAEKREYIKKHPNSRFNFDRAGFGSRGQGGYSNRHSCDPKKHPKTIVKKKVTKYDNYLNSKNDFGEEMYEGNIDIYKSKEGQAFAKKLFSRGLKDKSVKTFTDNILKWSPSSALMSDCATNYLPKADKETLIKKAIKSKGMVSDLAGCMENADEGLKDVAKLAKKNKDLADVLKKAQKEFLKGWRGVHSNMDDKGNITLRSINGKPFGKQDKKIAQNYRKCFGLNVKLIGR